MHLKRSDKVKQTKTGWLAVATALGIATSSAIATPARDTRQDMDHLERQRQQEQIQKEIERERAFSEQHRAVTPAPDAKEQPLQNKATFLVSHIQLLGDDSPSAEAKAILAAYEGKTMGAAEIMAVVRDLTNHYIERGYVTTVVTVHPGTLKSGTLTLEVKWGTIKDMTRNGKPVDGIRDTLRLFGAMPFAEGARLSLQDIDQAVDNLVRGGGNDKIRIVPGDEVGSSVLDVTGEDPKLLNFGIGVNNSGREVEGWNQYSTNFGINNVLGLNDSISAYYAQQDFKDSANSQRIGSVNYSLPIGYWTFDASWYGSQYEKMIDGYFGRYASDGTSQRLNLKLSRVLHRDAQGKTSGYMKFANRSNTNGIEGTQTSINSKRYSEVGAGVTHVGTLANGWLYADLGVNFGVPWMGGAWRSDPDLAGFDTDFTKFNGMATWTRPFKVGNVDFVYDVGTGFQYSPNTLVTDARLSIGDEYTVRGFKDTAFYGDSGAYLSNTLRLPLRANVLGGIEVAPFVGYDGGVVKNYAPGSKPEYVMGAAVGFRFSGKYLTSSLSYGWPIASPAQSQTLARALNYRLDLRY
ncbi:ShlB/FhaC/HecB family hemolysin secretion/activation protein [Cupriavidus campinensis]|uniref:ShlB/FhaC/HecB family hemolysin secretion/activation protein n=1 Tax=Cupriavidus campinensis TaxID=151783 RepID=A0ABY3EGS5_9BURK|nr:ShlB/FhaC/HecB family hemolysin secretion/activation protein [Cupriavidus campinensis]